MDLFLKKLNYFNFLFERDMLWIFPTVFLISVAGLSLLIVFERSSTNIFKNILYIPANKSITNAVQLGGLPVSLSIITGIFFLYNHVNFNSFFRPFDHFTIKYWLLSSLIIVVYGYFDDRFELRPIVKLISQLLSVGVFAILESRVVYPEWSALAFVFISFWGLGLLNGCNLLDGLDTLTFKLSLVTLFSFLVISWNFNIASSTLISFVMISVLMGFYIFNKEPSMVHLGEIGGSFFGFSFLLIGSLVYSHLIHIRIGHLNALAMSLFPLSLAMVELGISFLRRIYNKNSPFRGDQFHLHHILRNYYALSPSLASTYYALGYAVLMSVAFCVSHYFGPVVGIITLKTSMIISYVMIGRKHWITDHSIDLNPASLFDYLLKKDVGVISSRDVDSFEITIIGEDVEVDRLEEENEKIDLAS